MAHSKRRQGGVVTQDDFAKLQVATGLPPAGHYIDRAEPVIMALRGARILAVGAADDEDIEIEGGGLVIDFESAEVSARRVVFGFNECGMWVEYYGPLHSKSA